MNDSLASPTQLADLLSPTEVSALSPGPCLGEGETSVVHLCEAHGRRLALKCAKPGFDQVLLREAEALALAAGPGVVGLFGVGLDQHTKMPRLALQYLQGPSIAERLETDLAFERRLLLSQRILAGCVPALLQLHALGWGHGDLKPANLRERAPDDERIALLDFGLASRANSVEGGTPRYLPPELFQGQTVSPPEADCYALFRMVAEILEPTFEPALGLQLNVDPHGLGPLLSSVLCNQRQLRPSLSALWDEILDRGIVAAASHQAGRVRREYVATRIHELTPRERLGDRSSGNPLQHIAEGSDVPKAPVNAESPPAVAKGWMGYLAGVLNAVETLRGSGLRAPTRTFPDSSLHDRRRFLARLLGPQAASWNVAGSDEKLVEALLALSGTKDLRSLTRSEFDQALEGNGASVAEVSSRTLDLVQVALRLTRQPVPRELLVHVARSEEATPTLRLEAARVARQMGQNHLARALLGEDASDAASLERVLLQLREGPRDRALKKAAELESSRVPAVAAHARALVARSLLDQGDIKGALRRCDDDKGVPLLEVRALALIASERYSEASEALDAAEARVETDEQAARLSAVRGMLAHARGEPARALSCFERAVEHASRAGAALEEATYWTGVAAAANDAGRLDRAEIASERAELLFEGLRIPGAMARAILARASVLSAVGAEVELSFLAERGLELAHRQGDTRCEAFLHLCLCDGLSDPARRSESARAAERLLLDSKVEDQLRAAARILSVSGRVDEETRAWERDVTQPEALLDWYRARAEALERSSGLVAGGESLLAQVRPVVAGILVVAQPHVQSPSKGPALVAGALLALRTGLTEDARQLMQRASRASHEFLSHVPARHQRTAQELSWVVHARQSIQTGQNAPAQLSDVENLLRALGRRDGFRGLLNQVLDLLLLWTQVERGILLLRAPGDKLVVRAARNVDRRDLSEEQRRLSLTMAERAMAERRPVVAVDAVSDMSSIHKSVHALSLRSVLAVPLVARGEVLGVAYLDDRVKRGAFGESELSWANLISTVAALAIADERDRLQLKRALRRTRRAETRLADRLRDRETELELATRELTRYRQRRPLRGDYSHIVHHSRPMFELLELVDRVAQSDVPALIVGESGTGKELIARAVADAGNRRDRPFVAENCAAVPEGLMESTLFGHQRGAFTGATRNQDGLFVLAHGGTLFLDEIGEMSVSMQTKLLRVLQEGQVRPLGASRTRPVDVRLIAATNRDLKLMVEKGTFREDLYYRLHVVQLNLPALRERPEDIPPLVAHFLKLHGDGAKSVSESAMARLRSYAWPGNVRQLENEVRRMIVLGGDELGVHDLSPEIVEHSEESREATTLREKVDALERRLLTEALDQTHGNRTRAAEMLGISRFGLQKMTQRLDIAPKRTSQRSGRIRDRGLDDSQ